MGQPITLAGIARTKAPRWSWCVPAGRAMSIKVTAVQVMADVGIRFMPTRIAAPDTYRTQQVPYLKLLPRSYERELWASSYGWRTHHAGSPVLLGAPPIMMAVNDMAAAERFLPLSKLACEPADPPVPDSALYLGRSVLVRPCGSPAPVTAWITSQDEPFEMVCLDFGEQPRKFLADRTWLMEDAGRRSREANGQL